MGVKCVAQNADISIYENIEALLKLTLDTFGHVDILVNNAGCAVSGAIWKLPKRDIDWITELNFLSHLLRHEDIPAADDRSGHSLRDRQRRIHRRS